MSPTAIVARTFLYTLLAALPLLACFAFAGLLGKTQDLSQTGATISRTDQETDGAHMLVMQKRELRLMALGCRASLPLDMRLAAAMGIADHAAIAPALGGVCVAGYWPIHEEADPRPLMDALRVGGAELCLPAVVGEDLEFRRLHPDSELVAAGFGTKAPKDGVVLPDVLLVPLAAFDGEGGRIGYGRGFYDRALASLSKEKQVFTIGVAFACQRVGNVPMEAHDRYLDAMVTEDGFEVYSEAFKRFLQQRT